MALTGQAPWLRVVGTDTSCSAVHSLHCLSRHRLQHTDLAVLELMCMPRAAARAQAASGGIHVQRVRRTVQVSASPYSGNIYKDSVLDLLPGGVPNTPVRRLTDEIRNAQSLRELMLIYERNYYKDQIWKDKHVAGIVQRVTALLYSQVIAENATNPTSNRGHICGTVSSSANRDTAVRQTSSDSQLRGSVGSSAWPSGRRPSQVGERGSGKYSITSAERESRNRQRDLALLLSAMRLQLQQPIVAKLVDGETAVELLVVMAAVQPGKAQGAAAAAAAAVSAAAAASFALHGKAALHGWSRQQVSLDSHSNGQDGSTYPSGMRHAASSGHQILPQNLRPMQQQQHKQAHHHLHSAAQVQLDVTNVLTQCLLRSGALKLSLLGPEHLSQLASAATTLCRDHAVLWSELRRSAAAVLQPQLGTGGSNGGHHRRPRVEHLARLAYSFAITQQGEARLMDRLLSAVTAPARPSWSAALSFAPPPSAQHALSAPSDDRAIPVSLSMQSSHALRQVPAAAAPLTALDSRASASGNTELLPPSPMLLVQLAQASARVKRRDPILCAAACSAFLLSMQLQLVGSKQLADFLWAMATLRHWDEALMQQAAAAIVTPHGGLSFAGMPSVLLDTVWAFQTLGVRAQRMEQEPAKPEATAADFQSSSNKRTSAVSALGSTDEGESDGGSLDADVSYSPTLSAATSAGSVDSDSDMISLHSSSHQDQGISNGSSLVHQHDAAGVLGGGPESILSEGNGSQGTGHLLSTNNGLLSHAPLGASVQPPPQLLPRTPQLSEHATDDEIWQALQMEALVDRPAATGAEHVNGHHLSLHSVSHLSHPINSRSSHALTVPAISPSTPLPPTSNHVTLAPTHTALAAPSSIADSIPAHVPAQLSPSMALDSRLSDNCILSSPSLDSPYRYAPALYATLCTQFERQRMWHISHGQLALFAHTLACAGAHNHSIWLTLGRLASSRVPEMDAADLTMLATAWATAGQRNEALFEAVACEVELRMREFTGLQLARLLWAFRSQRVKVLKWEVAEAMGRRAGLAPRRPTHHVGASARSTASAATVASQAGAVVLRRLPQQDIGAGDSSHWGESGDPRPGASLAMSHGARGSSDEASTGHTGNGVVAPDVAGSGGRTTSAFFVRPVKPPVTKLNWISYVGRTR